ncbi:hypothetical protein FA13DRAFT_1707182 [Coprinellus micaceus]|uniref:YDG domain-containing protein n=1 Tax=Coprinellus micaceus TaxID=71717 RepID=A0A4Y7TN94_COPMI|nr:hypothetical protein FA13DRAFT_1707182 [Coprinellus micaceus]
MVKLSAYELEREANIARNKALLEQLGLDKPAFEQKEKARKKAPAPKKRKAESVEAEDFQPDAEDDSASPPPAKASKKAAEDATPREGLRRSSRTSGKKIDYTKELKTEVKTLTHTLKNTDGKMGSDAGMKRKHSPKVYGSIPGIEVGTWWETRAGCSADAIHAPWVGGISGSKKDGAHSVALSGGYDDDVDLGYALKAHHLANSTYTGSGGRDLKGTKNAPKNLRTAPQSSDQTFDNTRSSQTRKPVRVIRGYKLRSKYGPSEGYRYDGLYAWIEKGLNPKGHKVCKFAFKRLPNQPALTVREFDPDQAGDENDEEEEEEEGGEEEGEARARRG